jgi:hypothetical protein
MNMLGLRITFVATLAAACLAAGAEAAPAPVPPRDCGDLRVGGKRFNIKSDQLRCRRARKFSRRYLSDHRKPRKYSCKSYGRDTAIRFRCSRGAKVFFAIRR